MIWGPMKVFLKTIFILFTIVIYSKYKLITIFKIIKLFYEMVDTRLNKIFIIII